MAALSLTQELGETLDLVARLERQQREAEHYQAVLERLAYLDSQLRSVGALLRVQKRTAVVLRRVFADRTGEQQWQATRGDWKSALPRQLIAPGRALSEATSDLLQVVDFLAAMQAALKVRNSLLAARLAEHLATAWRRRRTTRPLSWNRVVALVSSYQAYLAAADAFVPPGSFPDLGEQIAGLIAPFPGEQSDSGR